MKHFRGRHFKPAKQFRYYVALFLFIVSATSGLVVSLPYFSQKVYAEGEEYAFNYSKANEDIINEDIGFSGGGTKNAVYTSTAAYARGGVFSEGQPPRLVPDKDYDGKRSSPHTYLYRGTFSCSGYKIGLYMLLDLPKPIGSNNAKGEIGYTSISGPGVNIKYDEKGELEWLTQQQVTDSLPAICRPANYLKANGITALNLPARGPELASWKSNGTVTPPSTGSTATPSEEDSTQLDCDTQFKNPLTWAICPTVDILAAMIAGLDNIVTSQMTIESDDIFCNNKTCDAYYSAWTSFRNIALGLLVVAGLTVLIAQALGMEILDAYTIRKVLPRVVMVAIAITVSWPIMKFLVELTNDLGHAVRHLILLPFSQIGSSLDLSFGGGITDFLGGLGVGVGAGGTAAFALWVSAGGIGVLFSYLLTGALAVGIAIIVLVLRQVIIIALILAAPIMILCYILPNTQKIYKFWWDIFIKALLMFPLIAAFIATGRVFSAISLQNGGAIYQLVGFISYFAPYFLIPLTFKFAGGAIRQIGGFVNDRSRGGFDMLRNYRRNQAKARTKAVRSGGLYRNDFMSFGNNGRSVGKLLNSLGNATVDAPDTWAYHLGKRGPLRPLLGRKSDILGTSIDKATLAHSQQAAKDLDLHYQAGRALAGQFQWFSSSLKPDALQELNNRFGVADQDGNITSWRAPTGKNEIEDVARILSTGSSGAREASQELMAKSSLLGSLKGAGKEETQRADLATIGLMAAASQGRLENSDIALADRSARQEGRSDFASLRTAQLQTMASHKRTSQSRGHGIEYRVNPETGTLEAYSVYEKPTSEKAQSSLLRMSTNDIAQSKSEDLDETRDTWLAGMSMHELKTDKEGNLIKDKNGNFVQGAEKTDKEKERAKQLQARMRTIAMYNQGDSDVGRKITEMYTTVLGQDRASDLQWGGNQLDREMASGGQGGSGQEPAPEAPQEPPS